MNSENGVGVDPGRNDLLLPDNEPDAVSVITSARRLRSGAPDLSNL